MDLQRRKNKKDGEVDLDDKVGELSSKHLGDQAGGDLVKIIPKKTFLANSYTWSQEEAELVCRWWGCYLSVGVGDFHFS